MHSLSAHKIVDMYIPESSHDLLRVARGSFAPHVGESSSGSARQPCASNDSFSCVALRNVDKIQSQANAGGYIPPFYVRPVPC